MFKSKEALVAAVKVAWPWSKPKKSRQEIYEEQVLKQDGEIIGLVQDKYETNDDFRQRINKYHMERDQLRQEQFDKEYSKPAELEQEDRKPSRDEIDRQEWELYQLRNPGS
jgi:hypothetical protein